MMLSSYLTCLTLFVCIYLTMANVAKEHDPLESVKSIMKVKSSEQKSHVAIYCKNVTESIQFYTMFGFELSRGRPDMGFQGAYLYFPNSKANEIHLISIKNTEEEPENNPDNISIYGRSHIAISIESGWDDLIEHCRKLKLDLLLSAPRPGDGRASLFVESADGNVLEISQAKSDWYGDASIVMAKADKAYNMLKEFSKKGNKVYPDTNRISRNQHGGKSSAASFDNPIATEIALKILRKGGSAADAAIAGNIALCVLEPMNGGLGGDFFAMIYNAEDDSTTGLNGSGSVPSDVDIDNILQVTRKKGTIPLQGPLSTNTIPGVVAAWCSMHKKYGILPWSELFNDAVQLAMIGFTVSYHTRLNWNHLLRFIEAYRSGLLSQSVFSDFMAIYAPGYVGPLDGEKYRNPALGRTLMLLAKGGCTEFYTGSLAREMSKHLAPIGVQLNEIPMKSFYNDNGGVEWINPLSSKYRNKYEILAFPDNSQGIAALQILKILENFDSKKLSRDLVFRLYCHLAAKRIVYIYERAVNGGDNKKTIQTHIQGIPYSNISRWIVDSYSKGIPFSPYELLKLKEPVRKIVMPKSGDTVGYVVRDSKGLIVSALQSLGGAFGSGVVIPELGFVLQNRGSGFAVKEAMRSHPNALRNGRRPFHTLCPWVIKKKGRILAGIAVKGGDKQPYAFTQILVNLVDRRMLAVDAVRDPRFRHVTTSDPTPNTVGSSSKADNTRQVIELESNFVITEAEIKRLFDLGIVVKMQSETDGKFEDSGFGIAQLVIVGSRGEVVGIADSTRKPGTAVVEILNNSSSV